MFDSHRPHNAEPGHTWRTFERGLTGDVAVGRHVACTTARSAAGSVRLALRAAGHVAWKE